MNAIQIENLWKEYRLGVIGHGTLTHDLQSWWAKKRGKEDPNARITPMLKGQKKQINGDHFWALQDINLEVKQGEVFGIIGRNGAGKSTLLKILSRVTAPSRGNIKVKGRIASLLEVGTGFHPELTGRENIFLNGAILGMSKQEVKNKLDEIIDFSDIEAFIDTPVKRYSSGMHVRLGFGVAAHLEPEILVIDEVLAVGDAQFQKKCLGKMGDISSKEGRTVIFVSHNMGAISGICNAAIMIENGEIALLGKTNDIITQYLNMEEKKPFNETFELGEYRARRGSGACRFRSIRVKNTNGEETFYFKKHDTIEFHFEVIFYSDIEKLLFFMHFESSAFPKGIASTGVACTPYIVIPGAPFEKNQVIHFKVIFRDIELNSGEYPIFYWLGESIYSHSIDAVDKITPNLVIESEGVTGLTSSITLRSELVLTTPDIVV